MLNGVFINVQSLTAMAASFAYPFLCISALIWYPISGVIHDIKRFETPMQKLEKIIEALLGGIKTPKTYVFGVLFICSYRRDIMVSD